MDSSRHAAAGCTPLSIVLELFGAAASLVLADGPAAAARADLRLPAAAAAVDHDDGRASKGQRGPTARRRQIERLGAPYMCFGGRRAARRTQRFRVVLSDRYACARGLERRRAIR